MEQAEILFHGKFCDAVRTDWIRRMSFRNGQFLWRTINRSAGRQENNLCHALKQSTLKHPYGADQIGFNIKYRIQIGRFRNCCRNEMKTNFTAVDGFGNIGFAAEITVNNLQIRVLGTGAFQKDCSRPIEYANVMPK